MNTSTSSLGTEQELQEIVMHNSDHNGEEEKNYTKKVAFNVKGMTCASCVSTIEDVLQNTLEGLTSVSVSLLSQKAEVTFDERKLKEETIEVSDCSNVRYILIFLLIEYNHFTWISCNKA